MVSCCPSCKGELAATRLACEGCGIAMEGQFELPALLRLSNDDLAFATAFICASGSLKEMAAQSGTSYPTVRARLDELIANIGRHQQSAQKRRHAILDALEAGKISVKMAEKKLLKEGL